MTSIQKISPELSTTTAWLIAFCKCVTQSHDLTALALNVCGEDSKYVKLSIEITLLLPCYGATQHNGKYGEIKKLNLLCGQQTPIVTISSLVSNVTNYYSVTDNIFQLIVNFWHMLLVNDDDDVGFTLAFFVGLCYVLHFFKYFYFIFVCVSMIN